MILSEEEIEFITNELWLEFANHSDGWQTTMDLNSFEAAIRKILELIKQKQENR